MLLQDQVRTLPVMKYGLIFFAMAGATAFGVAILASAPLRAAELRPDVKATAQAVDEHYNHLRTLQAEFIEIYQGSGMERTESGTLWLKKSEGKKSAPNKAGKMRWEYRSPRE